METNTLGALINALKSQTSACSNQDEEEKRLELCVRLLEEFFKSNEMKFRFDGGAQTVSACNEQERSIFYTLLNSSWAYLNRGEKRSARENGLHVRIVTACLNSIRIISRDPDTIKLFENAQLLELIQVITKLDFHEDKIKYADF